VTLFRFGLVGAGPWGAKILRTLADMPEIRLTRVASRNPAIRSIVGSDCIVSADWRELVTAADLDGVLIAAPPLMNGPIARAALAAGLPTFAEKPIASDPNEARDLLSLAETLATKGPVVCQVNHIDLVNPAYCELKVRLAELGRVEGLVACFGRRWPVRTDCPMVWEWGPHLAAATIDLIGEPESMTAQWLAAEPALDAEDKASGVNMSVTAENEGRRATLTFGNGMAVRQRWIEVQATGGQLRYDDERSPKLSRVLASGEVVPISVPALPSLTAGIHRFVAAVAAGTSDWDDLRLGCSVTNFLARCIIAAGPQPALPPSIPADRHLY
jgi:predicted dehydrogenase